MIEIKIDGNIYGGWKTARVERGIEQMTGSFDLEVTDLEPGREEAPPIRRGDHCEVLVDGETVITGWVDEASPSFSEGAHGIKVSGRDTTGDLVDCSAIHKSGQWKNATLWQVARDLCAPFGIAVSSTDIGKPFDTFSLQEGESVYECLERACRLRALLPMADGQGGLLLTRAGDGPPVATLEEGVNILAGAGQFSNRERYSKYIIKGSDRGCDDNAAMPETHSQVRAEALDSLILRYRPLVVLAESRGQHATYKERAEWERNVRRGRSSRASVTVQGWRTSRLGAIWQPNTMVHLRSKKLEVDAPLLITSLAYTEDDKSGSRTELHLAGREAFDLIVGKKAAGVAGKIREKHARGRKKTSGGDWSLF